MATYDGPPTPGWAMRACRVRLPGQAALDYDERARRFRELQKAAAARKQARR